MLLSSLLSEKGSNILDTFCRFGQRPQHVNVTNSQRRGELTLGKERSGMGRSGKLWTTVSDLKYRAEATYRV